MSKKIFVYKAHVNKILRTCSLDYINVYDLVDGQVEYIDDVYKYLLDLFIQLNENETNNYITKILLAIKSIYECYDENKKELDATTIEVMRMLESKYNNLVTKKGIEPDNYIIKLLAEMNSFLDQKYPHKDPMSMDEYEERINDLNMQSSEQKQKIITLSTELSRKDDKLSTIETKNLELQENNSSLKKKNKTMEIELREQKKQNKTLQEQIDELDSIVSTITTSNKNLQDQLNEQKECSKALSSELNLSTKENEKLKSTLEQQTRENEKRKDIMIREKIMDDYIIAMLLNKSYNLNEIISELKKEGFDYSVTEIKESLNRIKTRLNIVNPNLVTLQQEYQVCSPQVITGVDFKVDTKRQCYNVLLTADWHLENNLDFDMFSSRIDKIYNYCSINNINLILNLGDLFNVKQSDKLKKYDENMKLIQKLVSAFPHDKMVQHAILGGNHDRRMLEVGIDPIKLLTDNREDFINLGYDDAQFVLNDNIIGLHHPGMYDINMGDPSSRLRVIKEYLKNYYKNTTINKKDVYIDLFGHFHSAHLDMINSYAFVPGYLQTTSKNINSVWHLKIYFNDLNKIDYIVVRLLINNGKCLKNGMELVYKKIKK